MHLASAEEMLAALRSVQARLLNFARPSTCTTTRIIRRTLSSSFTSATSCERRKSRCRSSPPCLRGPGARLRPWDPGLELSSSVSRRCQLSNGRPVAAQYSPWRQSVLVNSIASLWSTLHCCPQQGGPGQRDLQRIELRAERCRPTDDECSTAPALTPWTSQSFSLEQAKALPGL
jgi:hypothetical protein